MKKLLFLLIVPLLQACPPKVEFVKKEFIVQGSSPIQKVSIDVPVSCEKFNTGVEVNVEAMVEYAGQEAALQASYEKILLISEFSERLKAITAAQCRIVQTATVIDPNTSDQTFYNDIVRNYTEYQKVRDLILANPSESQKDQIVETILSVYGTIYNNKKDELIDYVENLEIQIDVETGAQVSIYKNDVLIGTVIGGAEPPVTYVIDRQYLLPEPNEVISFRFVASAIGFQEIIKSFSLAELQSKKENKGQVDIDLKIE